MPDLDTQAAHPRDVIHEDLARKQLALVRLHKVVVSGQFKRALEKPQQLGFIPSRAPAAGVLPQAQL